MKTIAMRQIYEDAAEIFRASGERQPTHCDVRCTVNDILEGYHRDGFHVRFDYSQDRAFSTVRRSLT